jgi:dipeptidyl aminopeptidase/acylaminoacyl peptidase
MQSKALFYSLQCAKKNWSAIIKFAYISAAKLLLMKPLSCLAIALLFFASSGYSQTKKDTLSVERALSSYSIKSLVFSPEGNKAVAVVGQTGVADDLPNSHIWMIDIATKTLRQFTYSQKSENSPKWSPDGKTLAFLSGRNGKPQIFMMDVNGGEAMQLTTSKTGVKSYEWKPSGGIIAYMDDEPESDAKQKREDDKYDENVVSESDNPTRIFTIDVDTKKATQVFKQKWEVDEMKWMPHGDSLLLITETLPTKEIPEQRLMLYSIKDSTATTIPSPSHPFWSGVKVTPDGKNIIYESGRNGAPGGNDILSQPIKTGDVKNLTIDLDRDVIDVKLMSDHNLLALVQNGFMVRLYEVNDKAKVKEYGIEKNVFSYDVTKNGSVIFEGRAPDAMPEIWFAGTDKKPVQISHFNKAFDSIPLVKPKYFTYKSFDGLKVEGAIYKPANAGNKLPLVVFIHGGPTGAFYDIYSPWVQLFVQKGYAVFCPNIRGSTGYGINYITSNRNDWGGSDFKDIMSGVDYLIANENIDSAGMGISGWSYGGYMSEWAITQTHRFKAAMSGAGLADLASEFGTEDNAAYDKWSMGSPYEQPDVFYKHSPISFISNAKTPTLIIQGEEDETDPKGQSQQLYRGLRFYNVPTELVLYPREPHGFREIKHSIDFYNRMLAWFEKYMPADVKPVAVKK